MRDRLPFLALAAAVGFAAACGGGGSETPPPTTAPPAAESAPAADEGGDAAAEAGGFGVAECDDFLTKYYACIEANVPEEGRAAARQSAEMTKQGLQQAAQAGAEDALKMACTQAADAAKKAMATYDCEW